MILVLLESLATPVHGSGCVFEKFLLLWTQEVIKEKVPLFPYGGRERVGTRVREVPPPQTHVQIPRKTESAGHVTELICRQCHYLFTLWVPLAPMYDPSAVPAL